MMTPRELLKKYPWLRVRNRFSGRAVYFRKNQEAYTEIDHCLPEGWINSFIPQMVEDLDKLLKKHHLIRNYRIMQIKEKYGGLRWYDNGITQKASEEYFNIMHKYENLSETTCIVCGKPGKMRNYSWISPYCSVCFRRENLRIKKENKEYFNKRNAIK